MLELPHFISYSLNSVLRIVGELLNFLKWDKTVTTTIKTTAVTTAVTTRALGKQKSETQYFELLIQ